MEIMEQHRTLMREDPQFTNAKRAAHYLGAIPLDNDAVAQLTPPALLKATVQFLWQ